MTSLDVFARVTSIPNSKLIKESKGERSGTSCIAESCQTTRARRFQSLLNNRVPYNKVHLS